MKFEGKKLLLLGSNVGTLDIIRYAKENGAITIVADDLPVEKSVGKQFADENALISTADMKGLEDYIRKNRIEGVFAGISEFNLLKAMELCRFFGFPFYCTRQQWDLIGNKASFRELCIKHRIPCPKTYYAGNHVPEDVIKAIHYPVVVKPVDASASVGVAICKDEKALADAIPTAISLSREKRIIVEEFFEGEEFAAHYSIVNGNVSLSCIDNRVPVAVHDGNVTTVPITRVYPSTFIKEYMEQVNDRVKGLCESLNLNTGVLFVQGLYNRRRNEFSIFEGGLRCAGEAPYRIIEKVNGISFMHNLVDYALLGKVTDYDASLEDPYLKGKCCCVTSFVSKGGTIGRINGYKEVQAKVPSIVGSECRYRVGDVTPDGNTLRQIVLRFVLVCDTKEQMIRDVETINNSVQVLDDKGNELCYKFDVKGFVNQ